MTQKKSKFSNEDMPAIGCKNIELSTLPGSTSPMAITRTGVLSSCPVPPKLDWAVILPNGKVTGDFELFNGFEGQMPNAVPSACVSQPAEVA